MPRQAPPLMVKHLLAIHRALKEDAEIWTRCFSGMAWPFSVCMPGRDGVMRSIVKNCL